MVTIRAAWRWYGKDKEPLARQLGASFYIDSQAADPAADLLE
jgi:hypothetical protein